MVMAISYKDMTDEQKEKYRKYHRAYYHAHREEILARNKRYKTKADREYYRKYYQENKERIKQQRKAKRKLPNRVTVVRCKDCKYAHKTYDGDCKYCDMFTDDDGNPIERYRSGDWFCADGERK